MPETSVSSDLDPVAVADFQETLKQSKRIIAVLGAGLSASSGLSTFRSIGGLWANQDVLQVASPNGFRHDPGMVWQFYSYRRREALKAEPNPAHYALAELARRVPGFVALSQNVDNLSPRAGHSPGQLKLLHGNLFDLRCVDDECGYLQKANFDDPLTPALDTAKDEAETMGCIDPDAKPKANPILLAGIARKHAQILGDRYDDKEPSSEDFAALNTPNQPTPLPWTSNIRLSSGLSKQDLPQCPKCKLNILRPAVVWFGEPLPETIVKEADALFEEPIDLCLVIGTSSKVWPAAGYQLKARDKGARIAVINTDPDDAKNVRHGRDWVFVGDAAKLLPVLLEPVIGTLILEKGSGRLDEL
ncbi:DHS-like NAD/FAD-binding domain-containing protein [Sarocladium strictum]